LDFWCSFGQGFSSSQRPLTTQDNTIYKQETNIHAPSGIRFHDSSNQADKSYSSDRATTGIGNYIKRQEHLNNLVRSTAAVILRYKGREGNDEKEREK
jgi:hypothetical protein